MSGEPSRERIVNHRYLRIQTRWIKSAALILAAALSGCADLPSSKGSFDKTLTVTGPARLELTLGSAGAKVEAGEKSEVRIHAEITVRGFSERGAQERLNQITQHPPIEESGNLIRIHPNGTDYNNAEMKLTILVPPQTEVHGTTGSGDIEISSIQGPIGLTSGSGDIIARQVAGEVRLNGGSSDVTLEDVGGDVQITTGSGDLTLKNIRGNVRAQTASGDVKLSAPGDGLTANTASGDVTVNGISSDARVRTASGDIRISGNPRAQSFWDLSTSSGGVQLQVPADASFRLYAHSSSGSVNTSIPVVVDSGTSSKVLRARVGDGKARVEVQTSSGDIAVQ